MCVKIVEISARNGDGVKELLETVDLVCELEDPRGCVDTPAELVVMEAKKTAKDGTVVNALVQQGTLKNGDILMLQKGKTQAKVSRLLDHHHKPLKSAGPSTPVSFLGFKELPSVGTVLLATNGLVNTPFSFPFVFLLSKLNAYRYRCGPCQRDFDSSR